ncbi:hypothetical protein [Streptomyces sp. NPDC002788]
MTTHSARRTPAVRHDPPTCPRTYTGALAAGGSTLSRKPSARSASTGDRSSPMSRPRPEEN